MPADASSRLRTTHAAAALACIFLAACATPPHPALESETPPAHDDSEASAGQAASASQRLQRAIQFAQPRRSNLARARSMLESVLADRGEDARALHPYARALLDQVNERLRLQGSIERLNQQLEHSGRQLRDSQQQREQLQRKLDALAEIEGSLAPRSPTLPVPQGGTQ